MRDASHIVRTTRLRLSPHRLSDFDDSLALWREPVVTRYIGGQPCTAEEVWARLHRYAGHWALMGFGYWVVREATSGRFVGEVGLADLHRTIEPPFGDAPEIGWALVPAAWGHGFASEAVQAALAWAKAHLAVQRSVCLIHSDNAASIRVAQRCGFREYARTTYKGAPSLLFERTPG